MFTFIRSKAAQGQPLADKRRAFLKTLGLGAGSVLGSTALMAKPAAQDLSGQVARLEAEQALRVLHQQFETAMNSSQLDKAVALFSEDAEVQFNGGLFIGREQGISRLFRQQFATSKSGKHMEPAPGFALAEYSQQEGVKVAADMRTAKAVLPYSIQVGQLLQTDTSLASMARLQGEGVRSWWEGGVYEISYRQDASKGSWQIQRLVYNTQARADYRAGRSCAKPISVATFASCFPVDPQGPDQLV